MDTSTTPVPADPTGPRDTWSARHAAGAGAYRRSRATGPVNVRSASMPPNVRWLVEFGRGFTVRRFRARPVRTRFAAVDFNPDACARGPEAMALRALESPDWPQLTRAVLGRNGTRREVVQRLADLIEPEERTCHMRDADWDDGQRTWGCICSECGAKHEHKRGGWMNFCSNCGAKVVDAE